MNLRQALRHTADQVAPFSATEAVLEAEVLFMHLLEMGRAQLYCRLEEELPLALAQPLAELVGRRQRGEPLAYLVGHREFYGLDFVVNKEVLIPRPETELLVAEALAWAEGRLVEGAVLSPSKDGAEQSRWLTIADVGTGCGNIAVTLALRLPQAQIFALDLSAPALEVAQQNARRHQAAHRITFLQGDLLAPLPQPVDLMVANLPYVRDDELDPLLAEVRPGVFAGEPELALRGGPDGLAPLRRFLAQAPAHLRPGGAIFLEVAYDQGEAVAALAGKQFPGASVSLTRDWGGWNRVVSIRT